MRKFFAAWKAFPQTKVVYSVILFELTNNNEAHPAYQKLEISNSERHYEFLQSIVAASIEMGRPFISQTVLKALNFHAIACLHTNAGEYRPCQVYVGDHTPPEFYRVPALMDDFVNDVNRRWETMDSIVLAAYALWKLNFIHPFINGNGRTARAACYFIICVSSGGLLPGNEILPSLLKRERQKLVDCLIVADKSIKGGEALNLAPLHGLIQELLKEQLKSA